MIRPETQMTGNVIASYMHWLSKVAYWRDTPDERLTPHDRDRRGKMLSYNIGKMEDARDELELRLPCAQIDALTERRES